MADGQFVLYIRKVIVNPLLGRKQCQVEIAHAEMAGVKKSVIRAELAKKFKASEDRISIVGVKPKYGGGKTSCFAAIYDDMDTRNKYDTKTSLYRDGVVVRPKRQSRKLAKELKGKRKKVKGTAKSKVIAGKRKKVKGTA